MLSTYQRCTIQNNLHSFLNPLAFTYIQKVGCLYGYPQVSPF